MSHSVRIICDFIEEGWGSMDHVADMLTAGLLRSYGGSVDVRSVRPAMFPVPHRTVCRVVNRYVYYPWILRTHWTDAIVTHVIDHSYAHLVHELPPENTVVTCHDIDAFRCLLKGRRERRSWLFRRVARRILSGMQKAARVICVSEATRHELLMHGLVDPQRIRVVHNAIDPDFSSGPNPEADQELARLLGPPVEGVTELLHVGSTARRKRLDVLLQVAVNLQRKGELVRLIRVGPEVPREL